MLNVKNVYWEAAGSFFLAAFNLVFFCNFFTETFVHWRTFRKLKSNIFKTKRNCILSFCCSECSKCRIHFKLLLTESGDQDWESDRNQFQRRRTELRLLGNKNDILSLCIFAIYRTRQWTSIKCSSQNKPRFLLHARNKILCCSCDWP